MTTRLAKKIVEETLELEGMELPNGAVVKRYLKPRTYEFDKEGNVIDRNRASSFSLESFVTYSNPKINLPIGEGKYVVIPKNADWSNVVGYVKISNQGKAELVNNDKIIEKSESAFVYPLPPESYIEDRSNLEKALTNLVESENKERIEWILENYKKMAFIPSAFSKDDIVNREHWAYSDSLLVKILPDAIAINSKRKENYYDVSIPLHNMGALYLQKGELDEAINYLRKVFDYEPDYTLAVQTHLNIGNAFLQKGLLEKAEEEFKKILEMNPGQQEALYSLGALEFKKKKNKERAFEYWSRINLIGNELDESENIQQRTNTNEKVNNEAKLDPLDFDKLYGKALSLYENKNYDGAIKNLEEIVESASPDYKNLINSYLYLGDCFYLKNEYEKAIPHYEKVISKEDGRAGIYSVIGYCYSKTNNNAKSIEAYRKAISIEPNNKLAHNNLGAAFQRQGLMAEAKRAYEAALQIDSDYQDARDNLNMINKYMSILKQP